MRDSFIRNADCHLRFCRCVVINIHIEHTPINCIAVDLSKIIWSLISSPNQAKWSELIPFKIHPLLTMGHVTRQVMSGRLFHAEKLFVVDVPAVTQKLKAVRYRSILVTRYKLKTEPTPTTISTPNALKPCNRETKFLQRAVAADRKSS